MGYGLDDRVSLPTGSRDLSLVHCIQTGSGAHPASYPVGTWKLYPWGQGGWAVKLNAHLLLVPRSRMVELCLYSPYAFKA
jgi:hypothetical protein